METCFFEKKYTENPLDGSCEFNADMGARRVDEQLHEALVMGRGTTGCEQVVRNVEQHVRSFVMFRRRTPGQKQLSARKMVAPVLLKHLGVGRAWLSWCRHFSTPNDGTRVGSKEAILSYVFGIGTNDVVVGCWAPPQDSSSN